MFDLKWYGAFVVSLGVVASLYNAAWPMGLGEILEHVQAVYDRTETFKADFVQETSIRSAQKVIREEGKVYFKRPGLMRWDYSKPKEKRVYISPHRYWLYIPGEKLAYMKEGEGASNTITRFLLGAGRLAEDFAASLEGSEGEYRLKLKPREKSTYLKSITVHVDPNTFLITTCLYHDDYGNEVKIKFTHFVKNLPLEKSWFQFSPSPEVEVLRMK